MWCSLNLGRLFSARAHDEFEMLVCVAFIPRKILVIGSIRRLGKVVQGPKNTHVC